MRTTNASEVNAAFILLYDIVNRYLKEKTCQIYTYSTAAPINLGHLSQELFHLAELFDYLSRRNK